MKALSEGHGQQLRADLAIKRNEEESKSKQFNLFSLNEDYNDLAWQRWHSEHQGELLDLSRDLNAALSTGKTGRIKQSLLRSLHFTQIRDRHDQISMARVETLRWIFNRTKPDEPDFFNFAIWLEDTSGHNNLYWIHGKPGSGKSTLMRLLSDAYQTREALKAWSGTLPSLVASAFFWLSGNDMQKSLKGLLRSLLFDVLSQDDSHIPAVGQW